MKTIIKPPNIHITTFHTKNNFKRNNLHKKNHRILTIRMKNHHILTIRMENHYTNMRINIFVVINQTNKHKAKIYNHWTYT